MPPCLPRSSCGAYSGRAVARHEPCTMPQLCRSTLPWASGRGGLQPVQQGLGTAPHLQPGPPLAVAVSPTATAKARRPLLHPQAGNQATWPQAARSHRPPAGSQARCLGQLASWALGPGSSLTFSKGKRAASSDSAACRASETSSSSCAVHWRGAAPARGLGGLPPRTPPPSAIGGSSEPRVSERPRVRCPVVPALLPGAWLPPRGIAAVPAVRADARVAAAAWQQGGGQMQARHGPTRKGELGARLLPCKAGLAAAAHRLCRQSHLTNAQHCCAGLLSRQLVAGTLPLVLAARQREGWVTGRHA